MFHITVTQPNKFALRNESELLLLLQGRNG